MDPVLFLEQRFANRTKSLGKVYTKVVNDSDKDYMNIISKKIRDSLLSQVEDAVGLTGATF